MERLTKRISENIIELSAKANPIQYNGSPQRIYVEHPFWNVFNRLCDYEDAEEQGLLLRLPCKIRDTVYRICGCKGRKYVDNRIVGSMTYRLNHKGGVVWEIFTTTADVLGKTVFLTQPEAEAKLEELQNEA